MSGLLRVVTLTFTGARKKNRTTTAQTPTDIIFASSLVNSSQLYGPSLTVDGIIRPPLLTDTDVFYSPNVGVTPYISPPQLASTPVLFAPTVNEKIQLPLVSNSQSFYGPTLFNQVTLVAPLLTDGDTFYGPSLGLNATAPLLSNSVSLYAPALFNETVIAAPLLSDGDTLYAPVLGQVVAAPKITETQTFNAPIVTTAQTVKLNTFATAPGFYGPQLNMGMRPALLSNTQTFPAARLNQTYYPALITLTPTFYACNVLSGTYSVTAPLIDTSPAVAGDNPPKWDLSTVDENGAQTLDTLRLRFKVGAGSYTTVDKILDDGELVDMDTMFPEFTGFAIGDVVKWNVCVVRDGVQVSDWSSEATWTIADGVPSAFSFTSSTGATASTVTASNTITPSGYSAATRITVNNGQYRINSGSWVSTEGVLSPGDTVQVRATSSEFPNVDTVTTLTIGGVSGTFTVHTAGSGFHPAQLFTDGTYGYAFDCSDTTRLAQNNDGTGTAADAQPVGLLKDISGQSRHFAAINNDTSRPLYNAGNKTITFDGVNDILKRDDAGLYASGSMTIILAFSAPAGNASDRTWWSEGSGPARYQPGTGVQNSGSTGGKINIVNDAGTTVKNTHFGGTTGLNNGTFHVATITDNGSTIAITVNRGASSSTTYTRSGTLALNHSSLGAMFTSSAFNRDALTLGRAVFVAKALTSQERADAEAWCAQPYGITLP